MKKLLLVIMFLIPCSVCSFWFKRKATFFIDKNISKNTKIVYLQDRNLYLDINDYVFGVVAAEMPTLFKEEALKLVFTNMYKVYQESIIEAFKKE